MSSTSLHILVNLFPKLRAALLIGPAEKSSSATFNSEIVVNFGQTFKKALASHDIFKGFKSGQK